jgi:hypothetical protein
MIGYLTEKRHRSIVNLPVSLPETELRRGRYLTCAQINLALGQTLRVRCLNLHLISVLTASVVPQIFNTALGLASAGLYLTPMMCSSALLLTAQAPGVTALNSFTYWDFSTPGLYSFVVSNNCSNADLSVALTGAVQLLN